MILLTRSRSLLQVYLGGHHRQYLWSEQSQSFHYVAEEKTQWEHCVQQLDNWSVSWNVMMQI